MGSRLNGYLSGQRELRADRQQVMESALENTVARHTAIFDIDDTHAYDPNDPYFSVSGRQFEGSTEELLALPQPIVIARDLSARDVHFLIERVTAELDGDAVSSRQAELEDAGEDVDFLGVAALMVSEKVRNLAKELVEQRKLQAEALGNLGDDDLTVIAEGIHRKDDDTDTVDADATMPSLDGSEVDAYIESIDLTDGSFVEDAKNTPDNDDLFPPPDEYTEFWED